jgi:hypothetical protein
MRRRVIRAGTASTTERTALAGPLAEVVVGEVIALQPTRVSPLQGALTILLRASAARQAGWQWGHQNRFLAAIT